MKYLKQFLIILTISFVGEALKLLLPLPIPASIYGMVILFAGLMTGIIPLASVKDTGMFLIEIMPVMFIPAGVGLMSSWGVLKPLLVPVSIITVVSLVMVMVVGGHCTQLVIRCSTKEVSHPQSIAFSGDVVVSHPQSVAFSGDVEEGTDHE